MNFVLRSSARELLNTEALTKKDKIISREIWKRLTKMLRNIFLTFWTYLLYYVL